MSQRLEFVTLATAENANLRHLCRCFGISPEHRLQVAGPIPIEAHKGLSPVYTEGWLAPASREQATFLTEILTARPSYRARNCKSSHPRPSPACH